MPYRLRDGLSFCQVDGGIIFLDVPGDRYFQLTKPQEHEFTALLRDGAEHAENLDALRQANIVLPTSNGAALPRAHPVQYPSCSALENPSPCRAAVSTVLEVLWVVGTTRRALRAGGLSSTIDGMRRTRARRLQHAANPPTDEQGHLAATMAALFHRARPFVPIDTCCLLDSVALIRFLARRRVFARLVFGVTGNPFSAHCWVQHGDMVLNDTVGHVASHTPIWEA